MALSAGNKGGSNKCVAVTANKPVCSIDGCNNVTIVPDFVEKNNKTLPFYLGRGDTIPTNDCFKTS